MEAEAFCVDTVGDKREAAPGQQLCREQEPGRPLRAGPKRRGVRRAALTVPAMEPQLQRTGQALPQVGVVAVGDSHRDPRPLRQVRVVQGHPLENIQVDHVIASLPQKGRKAPVVLRQVPLAARELPKPDPVLPQRLGEHAVFQLRGDDVHLQAGQVHAEEDVVQKGLNAAGLPALAKAANSPHLTPTPRTTATK